MQRNNNFNLNIVHRMNQPLSSRQDIWTDWNFENAGKNHAIIQSHRKNSWNFLLRQTPNQISNSSIQPIKIIQRTNEPTNQATNQPTKQASKQPTKQASKQPTNQATNQPTKQASKQPTKQASKQPSKQASNQPFIHVAWGSVSPLLEDLKQTSVTGVRECQQDARHRYLWQHFGNTWHFLHTVDGSEILLTSWGW